jgi:hypothetical protein
MAFLCLKSVFSAESRGTGVCAALAPRGRAAPSRLGPSILLLQQRERIGVWRETRRVENLDGWEFPRIDETH